MCRIYDRNRSSKTAPALLYLRAPALMRFLHFRHPWRSYVAVLWMARDGDAGYRSSSEHEWHKATMFQNVDMRRSFS